jgi:hypothetical protein
VIKEDLFKNGIRKYPERPKSNGEHENFSKLFLKTKKA